MNLGEFRSQNPQYDDLSDRDLAGVLHETYYADIPQKRFFETLDVPHEDWALDDKIEGMSSFSRGFAGGLRSLGAMTGGAIAAISDTFGYEDGQAYGIDMFREYQAAAARYLGRAPTLEEVFESDDKFSDFIAWLGNAAGQGAAASIPALLAFGLNPALGVGVVYGMSVGEAYGAMLKNSEDPVAAYALAAGIPYAMAERAFGAGAQVARAIRGSTGREVKSP